MTWLIFALASALLFGIAQVFAKKGLATISPLWNCLIDAAISFLIYIPLALFLGVTFAFTPYHFLLLLCITALYLFIYYAIEKAQVSISGTIFASYPVVTVMLSYLFLNEAIRPLQFVAIIFILLGGICISFQTETVTKIKATFKKNWLAWALFGAVTTGVGDFLAKVALHDLDIHSYIFLFGLAFPFSVCLFWLFDTKGRKLPQKISFSSLQYTLIGTIGLSLGVLAISYAFAYGPASLVSVVSTTYLAIMIILAKLFLRETITRNQLIGIILTFLGVLIIAL